MLQNPEEDLSTGGLAMIGYRVNDGSAFCHLPHPVRHGETPPALPDPVTAGCVDVVENN